MGTFTAHPYLHEKLPYDQRDIVPVAGTSTSCWRSRVPSTLPAGSLPELGALARDPGPERSNARPSRASRISCSPAF